METNKKKKNIKTVLVAVAIIGVCALAFQVITKILAENELNQEKEIPTNYSNFTAETITFEEDILNDNAKASNSTEETISQEDVPNGYTKANYTIGKLDYDFCKDEKETSAEITKEVAAEIAAKELYKVFGVDLEGQEIKMGYNPANENFPRSKWQGVIDISDDLKYWFTVDSISGEIFHIGTMRIPDEQVSMDIDSKPLENYQEYIDLATNTAEKYDIINGKVKSVEYGGIGWTCKDYKLGVNTEPTVSFNITGVNGELASITFSRYDKALLNVFYNARCILTNEWIKKVEEQHEKAFEMYLEDYPQVAKGEEEIDTDVLDEYYERLLG